MRIAVVNEVSARDKNKYILQALEGIDAEVSNVGMRSDGEEPELTYIHTGLMTALALNTGAADFVIGGCGTGLGYLLSAMQYPGVTCGHILDPLDAWLFSQINGGNCISLALNKGFGWAGDINLKYIFEKLFCDKPGQGYPPHRSESQRESRGILDQINAVTHQDILSILHLLDEKIVSRALGHGVFMEFIERFAREGDLKNHILNLRPGVMP